MEKFFKFFRLSVAFSALIVFLVSLSVISCKDQDKPEPIPGPTPDPPQRTTPTAGSTIDPVLYNLILSEADFMELKRQTGDSVQIAFEFVFLKASRRITLKPWPAKNSSEFGTSNILLSTNFPSRFNITDQDVFFSIQKLNRKKIKTLADELGADNPTDKVLVFYPEINRKGKLKYFIVPILAKDTVNISDKAPSGVAGSTSTNPSPPGRFNNVMEDLDLPDDQ